MSASVQQSLVPPARNPWDVAVQRLSDEEKAHLDPTSTAKLDELLSVVQSRIQESERRQWVVKNVVLRDVFNKIAKWIAKFIEVGDVAVQYDPGHAALPWAAIRFLLKVSVLDINQYAVIVEGVEKVANVVARYRIIEKLYLMKLHEATTQLEEHIADLYTLVLKFLVKAKEFYRRNTAIRALKNLTDFNNKLQRYLENITKKDQETQSYTALADAEYRQSFEKELATLSSDEANKHEHLKSVLNSLRMPIDRIERDYKDLRDDLGDAKRTQILQWISPIPYEQHHNQARKNLLAGTGHWFLNDDRLLGWRGSSASSVLWLRGIPGSGKSKLMSIFIQQQLEEFEQHRNPNPIYFYCARNTAEPERSRPDAILRSLVRQLAILYPRNAILEPVRKMYKAREDGAFASGTLTLEESTALIIQLSHYRQLTTIVVDALDECEQFLRLDLLGAFNKILQASHGLVKILVSSRDVGDLVDQLEGCLNLEILASKNQEDIAHFVDWGVDDLIKRKQLLSGKVSDDLRQEIKRVLGEKAGGMFRWVSLQLDFLRGLKWEPAVKSRLRKLPTTLLHLYNETYSQNVESRAEEEQNLTKDALRLLLCLQTPLRTGDFMLALCSCEDAELSAEDLVDLCSNFVVLDTALDVFRFAHLSVREFLEIKADYEPDRNHAVIAKLCLKYLSTSTVTKDTGHWNDEIARLELDSENDNPSSLVLVHKHPSKAAASLWRMGGEITSLACGSCWKRLRDCPVFYFDTPENHIAEVCGDCVEKGRICESEDSCPLAMSLTYGKTNTVTTKQPYPEDGGAPGDTPNPTISFTPFFLNGFHQYSCLYWPFHVSKSMNHRLSTPLQTIFLDFMIGEQQTASTSFMSWNNTVLSSARLNFRDLTWGYDLFADRKIRDGISLPADSIYMAAIWDFCDVLELRLNVDPEAIGNVSQVNETPVLHFASAHGSVNAVHILLEKGAKLEQRDRSSYTALGIAIESQQREIVHLLLERGADASAKQGDCYTLHQAVKKGHLDIIYLLLKYGAAPERGCMLDDPTLSLVASKGNEEAMKLLLDNLKNTDSSIKLLWKTVTRVQKVMRTEGEAGLLQSLSTWPTSTIANQFLGTVLWTAVERKDESCARLLLARKADPNSIFENVSVFETAARPVLKGDFEQLKFVEMLLAHGADPNVGKISRRLLALAIDYDRIDLLRLFADAGADLDGDPLVRAVRNRNVEIVRFLLDRGADPKEVSVRFFAGDLEPRGMFAGHSVQDSEDIGGLLSAHGGGR